MVIGIVLRARQACGVARRDDRGLKAARDVHDGREHVLHVRNPQIERARAEDKLRADRVRERNDALVAVHRRKAGAADAVELYALRAVLLRERNHLLRASDADDLADERRQMPVDGDVDPALFERADVDLRGRAVSDAKERVRRDVRRDDARVAECQPAAQELFHDALPAAVRAAARAVERVEHLVVRADGEDVEFLPHLLPLGGRECGDGAVLLRERTRQIGEEDVGELAREPLRTLSARRDAKCVGDLADALGAEQRQLQLSLGGKFQREEHLARMCAVLCDTARRAAQEVARHDEVGIRAADAARALRRDLAGTHVAVLAADARHAERALRLLLVKPVERRVAADLLHVEQHLTHCGVGRLCSSTC